MSSLPPAVASSLPYLRRYARALTGTQAQGDNWVRLCAEVLLMQPELTKGGADSKLAVFRLFHRLQQPFRALDKDPLNDSAAPDAPGRLKASLTEIPILDRQMLLLTVLEGFTVADAATIVGVPTTEAEAALARARDELQRVASVRVLVIEDEAVIALDVAKIVRNAGHQVVGIAATEKAAVDLARKHAPHLVLADIQLKGGDSGIEAVRKILEAVSAPVIFVTGFPERLLTGHGLEPAFVITKPFDPDLLKTAMAQALNSVAV
jgi:CheY-like chemotaxis protein